MAEKCNIFTQIFFCFVW